MPSTSKKQHNFMAAAAHNPAFAKKAGISQNVAKEFNQADKGRKFGSGGMAKENAKMDKAQDKAMIKKAFKQHDAQEHKGGKGTKLALKKGGLAAGHKSANGIAKKGLTKGKEVRMCVGGMGKKAK
jgi:hypothetical protein